jgi:predicted HTH domain antitoxin
MSPRRERYRSERTSWQPPTKVARPGRWGTRNCPGLLSREKKEPVPARHIQKDTLSFPALFQAVSRSKDVRLSIPRSVADALALPEGRKKEELQRELAVSLYREDMLSFGKARELAGMSKQEFGQLLGDRGVERHYGPGELAEDLRYAKWEGSFHDEGSAK